MNDDREATPARGTPLTMLDTPAVEANGNGRDHRRETTTARPETREEQIDRAILEGVAERQHINGKLSEHDRRFDRIDADLDILVAAQRQAATAAAHPMRAPMASVHDTDLEVGERTLNGSPRAYLVPAEKLAALLETERRYSAIGEAERTRVAVEAALNAREGQRSLERAASPMLFVTGKAWPALVLAAIVGGAALLWNRLLVLLHVH